MNYSVKDRKGKRFLFNCLFVWGFFGPQILIYFLLAYNSYTERHTVIFTCRFAIYLS
jgi:hypothetical protein